MAEEEQGCPERPALEAGSPRRGSRRFRRGSWAILALALLTAALWLKIGRPTEYWNGKTYSDVEALPIRVAGDLDFSGATYGSHEITVDGVAWRHCGPATEGLVEGESYVGTLTITLANSTGEPGGLLFGAQATYVSGAGAATFSPGC